MTLKFMPKWTEFNTTREDVMLQESWSFLDQRSKYSGWAHMAPIMSLTHLPPGQNGCYSTDDIFRYVFLNEKFCILIKISLKFIPKGPIDNNPSIGSDNGLAPNMRQVINWTNADLIHWRIYAALGGNQLTSKRTEVKLAQKWCHATAFLHSQHKLTVALPCWEVLLTLSTVKSLI